MLVDTIVKQLLFTAVHIVAEVEGRTSSGTGFIYDAGRTKGAVLPVLITNKHVVAGAKQIRIRLIGANAAGDQPELGNPVEIVYSDVPVLWTGHPDTSVDVTAMFLGPTLNQIEESGRRVFFRMGGRDLYPSDAALADLDAVEDILFVGYPNGLYDSANHTPIVRRGVTATPVQLNWSGTPTFLIDASVFPGSSGSPVFLLQQGVRRQDGGISIGGAPRFLLLGIVASVMIQPTTGAVVARSAGRQISVNQMIDLGIVYNWRAIEETVDALCRAHSVDRAESLSQQVSTPPVPPAAVGDI